MNDYLDVVTQDEIRKNFDFYALGSVVQIMIHQRYDILVDMIATTKLKLPVDKPLHLFGAGHPAMFALATFMGCDTFDEIIRVIPYLTRSLLPLPKLIYDVILVGIIKFKLE